MFTIITVIITELLGSFSSHVYFIRQLKSVSKGSLIIRVIFTMFRCRLSRGSKAKGRELKELSLCSRNQQPAALSDVCFSTVLPCSVVCSLFTSIT